MSIGEAKVEDHKIVQRNLALQREWYGEPLGDRVRDLVVAFDVSQAQLAEVLGISAPMLSQVMSGRRAKIGNPAVLARMMMLERKVLIPEVRARKPEALRAALEDVRQSKPTVSREVVPTHAEDVTSLVELLRRLSDPRELRNAANALGDVFPFLGAALLRAAKDE